jgi:phosphoribosylamine-glycine ligase
MMACVEGRLLTSCKNPKCKPRKIKTKVDDRQSAVVVLAAPAFPQDFRTNLPIYINRLSQSTSKYIIYFLLQLAKSKVDVLAELKEGDLPGEHYNFYLDAVSTSEPSQERPTMESTGGRIMAVSAQAKTIEGALERAYGIARQIEFGYDVNNEPYYRSDIGI